MNVCGGEFSEDIKLTDEDVKRIGLLRDIQKTIEGDALLRKAFLGTVKGGGSITNDIRGFIELRTGLKMGEDSVPLGDLYRIASDLNIMKKTLVDLPIVDGKISAVGLQTWFEKTFLAGLPQDHWRKVGLSKVFEETTVSRMERDGNLDSLAKKVRGLQKTVESIFKIDIKVAQDKLTTLDAKEGAALRKKQILKEKGADVDAIAKAQAEVDQIREDKRQALADESDPSMNVLMDLGMALNGGEKGAAGFAKKYEDHSSPLIKALVDEARDFTEFYKNEAKEALRDNKHNLIQELMHKGFEEKDAIEIASKRTEFEEIENYYPHHSLMNIYSGTDLIANIQKANSKEDIFHILNTVKAPNVEKSRTLSETPRISWNSLHVLGEYGKQVVQYRYAQKVHKQLFDHIAEIGKLDVVKNSKKNNKRLYEYYNGLRRMAINRSKDLIDTRAGNQVDDVVRTAVAWQTMLKLTNFRGSILNVAEGVLHNWGWHGWSKNAPLAHVLNDRKTAIREFADKFFTDFRPEDIFSEHRSSEKDKMIKELLSEGEFSDYDFLAESNSKRISGGIAKGVQKAASFGMKWTGWTKGENYVRRQAFEMGVAEGMEFVETMWKGRFLRGGRGDVPDYMRHKFELDFVDGARTEWGNTESSMKAYNKFKDQYLKEQGFRSIMKTQYDYDISARAQLFERGKMKWLTHLTHYNRALTSVLVGNALEVKSLYEVGGFEALFSPNPEVRLTTQERMNSAGLQKNANGKWFKYARDLGKGGFILGQPAHNLITLGSAHMIRRGVRAMFGIGASGLILGNFASHPVLEVIDELKEYWGASDYTQEGRETKARTFYGKGVLNSFTGPILGDAMDVIAWAGIKHGVLDGSMHSYVNDTLRLTTGWRPSQVMLSEHGYREYTELKHVLNETMGWEASAIYPQGKAMLNLMRDTDYENIGRFISKVSGVRPVRG